MAKYPYIANKKLYAATMFACKMIRENGYLNKAVKIAANYYDVDEDDVLTEIRKRQSAGQKGKKKGKYKYYTCCIQIIYNDGSGLAFKDPFIRKAMSKSNVTGVRSGNNRALGNYYAEWDSIAMKEYGTKEEAERHLANDFAEIKKGEY